MVGMDPTPRLAQAPKHFRLARSRMEKQKAKTRAFKMVELISRGLDARKNPPLREWIRVFA